MPPLVAHVCRHVRTQRTTTLVIPAYLLSARATYEATLAAEPTRSHDRAAVASGSASILIRTVASPLHVQIAGGDWRSVGSSLALTLDANATSYDPDDPSATDLTFVWIARSWRTPAWRDDLERFRAQPSLANDESPCLASDGQTPLMHVAAGDGAGGVLAP